MQATSALYKSIIAGDHYFETKISIAGNEIDDFVIAPASDKPGMTGSTPTVGGAVCATFQVTIINPAFEIPARAEIKVYVRARNATQTSEWLPSGTYYIDTREKSATDSGIDTLTINAFDAMIKTEQDYPATNHVWPYPDKDVVAEIAQIIGVDVDSRTYEHLNAEYMVELPTGYTIREKLEHIAAANCGNFVITAENKLLFVPLFGLDPETNLVGNYLAVEGGTDALIFGDEGWYILV